MKSFILKVLLFFSLSFFAMKSSAQSGVFVNHQELSPSIVQALELYNYVKIQKGSYWYDPACGLWGLEGKEAAGFILPGLNFGGHLRPNASKGNTGIFINGRQINATEQQRWQLLLGQTTPGRYLLDALGNLYYENGIYLTNIVQLAQQHRQKSSSFYRSTTTDVGIGSDGNSFYIMGEDFSYSNF